MANTNHSITVGIDVVIQSVRMGATRAPSDTEPARDTPSRSYPTLEEMAGAMAYAHGAVWDQLSHRDQTTFLNEAGALLTALGVPGGGLCQETITAIAIKGEEPVVLRCVIDARHAPPHRTSSGASWVHNPFTNRPGTTCCTQFENCCLHDPPQKGCACCEHAVKIGTRRWTE